MTYFTLVGGGRRARPGTLAWILISTSWLLCQSLKATTADPSTVCIRACKTWWSSKVEMTVEQVEEYWKTSKRIGKTAKQVEKEQEIAESLPWDQKKTKLNHYILNKPAKTCRCRFASQCAVQCKSMQWHQIEFNMFWFSFQSLLETLVAIALSLF